MTAQRNPKVDRKQRKQATTSPWTKRPMPPLDWSEAIRTIQEVREWLRVSDEEAAAEGVIAATLLLDAIDESHDAVVLVERMLTTFGLIAYGWAKVGNLSQDLQRRVTVIVTAANDDPNCVARQVEVWSALVPGSLPN